jgi:hypothetical protein
VMRVGYAARRSVNYVCTSKSTGQECQDVTCSPSTEGWALNLNSVNQLIFVMVKCGVLFEVRTGFLCYLDELRLQRVKWLMFNVTYSAVPLSRSIKLDDSEMQSVWRCITNQWLQQHCA